MSIATNILDVAQYWQAGGIAVLPIPERQKAARIKWKKFQSEIPSAAQLQTWFNKSSNLAIVTGHRGLTVIDFDDLDVYDDWLKYGGRCRLAGLVQRFTYQVETGKGRHVYIRLPEATKSRALLKPDGARWGIDIKSRGGYVLAPPSFHPSGRPYRAVNPGAMLMLIQALSDILPTEMLARPEYQPQRVVARTLQPSLDPWAAAMNPVRLGRGVVERIKEQYHLEDILPVEQETGPNFYLTRCPLHDDHKPSMWVQTTDQICGCHAGCTDKPLDVINLYARIHDLSNEEAIRELARGL